MFGWKLWRWPWEQTCRNGIEMIGWPQSNRRLQSCVQLSLCFSECLTLDTQFINSGGQGHNVAVISSLNVTACILTCHNHVLNMFTLTEINIISQARSIIFPYILICYGHHLLEWLHGEYSYSTAFHFTHRILCLPHIPYALTPASS